MKLFAFDQADAESASFGAGIHPVEVQGSSSNSQLSYTQASSTRKTANPAVTKVLRRFTAVLLAIEGESASVLIRTKTGEEFSYDLPKKILADADVTIPNQPFQMDEIEVKLPGAIPVTTYSIIPLAKATDAYQESLEYSPEIQQKVNSIYNAFRKAEV